MVAEITAGISLYNTVIDVISKNKNAKTLANELIDKVGTSANTLLATNGSMTKLLGNYIICPNIIVSNNAKNVEIIDKVIELQLDTFASFYTQAFQLLVNMYDMKAVQVIDIMGTNNGSMVKAGGAIVKDRITGLFSGESDVNYLGDLLKQYGNISNENDDGNSSKNNMATLKNNIATTDMIDKLAKQQNLFVVQRSLEITTSITKKAENGKEYTSIIKLPLTIRASIVYTDTPSIINAIEHKNYRNEFGYRVEEYLSGGISLMDLVFAGDLISQYKNNKLKDKNGLMDLLSNQRLSANVKVAYDNAIGFEKHYNMIIITDADKLVIDKALAGDLYKEKAKESFLDRMNGLSYTVLDTAYERLAMFIDGIPGMADTTFKSIGKRKDSGSELSEFVKAMLTNKPIF